MGWLGISNSTNRVQSQYEIGNNVELASAVRKRTARLSSALTYQMGRADALASVVRNQPADHTYTQNQVSTTAGRLAADLAASIHELNRFAGALSGLTESVDECIDQMKEILRQYDLPRVYRTMRLLNPDVPPSGQELVAQTKAIADYCITAKRKFVNESGGLARRAFSGIDAAHALMTNPEAIQSNHIESANKSLTKFLNS